MSVSKSKSPYGWIRAEDCALAEKIGYAWRELNAPKTDFAGRVFTHVLSRDGYLDHVLEPDTRVPNFTTSFVDAARLAAELRLDTAHWHAEILGAAHARL